MSSIHEYFTHYGWLDCSIVGSLLCCAVHEVVGWIPDHSICISIGTKREKKKIVHHALNACQAQAVYRNPELSTIPRRPPVPLKKSPYNFFLI